MIPEMSYDNGRGVAKSAKKIYDCLVLTDDPFIIYNLICIGASHLPVMGDDSHLGVDGKKL